MAVRRCTDEQGKATLIAMALTIIQRHDFTETAGFLAECGQGGNRQDNRRQHGVGGGARPPCGGDGVVDVGGGDGARRCSRSAAAGSALVVFDNLRRGTEIHDETIEKVQTSRRYSARRLGVSEQEGTTPARSPYGRATRSGRRGDSTSRNLAVTLHR